MKGITAIAVAVGWIAFAGMMAQDNKFWPSMFVASLVAGLVWAYLFGNNADVVLDGKKRESEPERKDEWV